MTVRRRFFRNSLVYVLLAALGFCMCFGMTALGKQLSRVIVNGCDVSGMSCSQAAKVLCDVQRNKSVSFGDTVITIGEFATVSVDFDKLMAIYELSTGGLLYKSVEEELDYDYKFDTKKTLKLINKATGARKARNAKVKIQGNDFEVFAAQNGAIRSLKNVKQPLTNWLNEREDFNPSDYLQEPEITENSVGFAELVNTLTMKKNEHLDLTVDGKDVYSVTALQFAKVKDGEVIFNKKAAKKWIATFAEETDTLYKQRQFKTKAGDVIKLNSGTLGWQLDQEEMYKAIKKAWKSDSGCIELPEKSRGAVWGKDDVGDTYIEVCIDKQHLWYFKDGQVVLESDFVSGLGSVEERKTKTGAHQILYMQRDRILRGAQRSYSSHVDYWMPFTWDGQGLHDASWRSSFGGDIWKYSGSHGCVNLPSSFAAELYSQLESGTPVIVY